MSTWINKTAGRRAGAVLLGLALAGCQPVKNLPILSLLPANEPLLIYDGDIRVTGPRHYCPDRSSLQETDNTAVVLLGRCSALSEAPPAVVTVSVGARGSAGVLEGEGAALAAYLLSDAGRASLSRNNRADEIDIRAARMEDGVFLVQVDDRRQGRYWRGMLPVAGYLVSVTATGPSLAPEAGLELVQQTARALQSANRPQTVN